MREREGFADMLSQKNQKKYSRTDVARAHDVKTKGNHKRRRFGCARASCWSRCRFIDFAYVIIYKSLKAAAGPTTTGSAFFRASSCGAIEFTATVVATSLSISSVEELFPLRFGERNWRFDGDVVRF
jgi:hypothetical protein